MIPWRFITSISLFLLSLVEFHVLHHLFHHLPLELGLVPVWAVLNQVSLNSVGPIFL